MKRWNILSPRNPLGALLAFASLAAVSLAMTALAGCGPSAQQAKPPDPIQEPFAPGESPQLAKLRGYGLKPPRRADAKAPWKNEELTKVEFFDKPLPEADLPLLLEFPNLESVNLQQGEYSDGGIAIIAKLPHLKELSLRGAIISFSASDSLAGHLKLESLDLGETNTGDGSLATMSQIKHLKKLNLEKTLVTDQGLDVLANCKSLSRLWLKGSKVTAGGYRKIKQSIPLCTVEGR